MAKIDLLKQKLPTLIDDNGTLRMDIQPFGTDAAFKQMKELMENGDAARLSELLLYHVCKACVAARFHTGPARGFSPEDMENLEQETFMNAWKKLDEFLNDPQNQVAPGLEDERTKKRQSWLKRVVYNKSVDMVRRKQVNIPIKIDDNTYVNIIPIDPPEGAPVEKPKPEEILMPFGREEKQDRIIEVMNHLYAINTSNTALLAITFTFLVQSVKPTRIGWYEMMEEIDQYTSSHKLKRFEYFRIDLKDLGDGDDDENDRIKRPWNTDEVCRAVNHMSPQYMLLLLHLMVERFGYPRQMLRGLDKRIGRTITPDQTDLTPNKLYNMTNKDRNKLKDADALRED